MSKTNIHAQAHYYGEQINVTNYPDDKDRPAFSAIFIGNLTLFIGQESKDEFIDQMKLVLKNLEEENEN